MLWFLALAAKKGFVVDEYRDNAIGTMGRNTKGKIVVETVQLRPLVTFSGDREPTPAELTALHHEAHETCYIANSINTLVSCEPVHADAAK